MYVYLYTSSILIVHVFIFPRYTEPRWSHALYSKLNVRVFVFHDSVMSPRECTRWIWNNVSFTAERANFFSFIAYILCSIEKYTRNTFFRVLPQTFDIMFEIYIPRNNVSFNTFYFFTHSFMSCTRIAYIFVWALRAIHC
jgi:hypothetical protein